MALFTPEGSLSYPKLFAPVLPKNAKPDDKRAWSTTVLFTEDDVKAKDEKGNAVWQSLVAAVVAKAKEDFPDASGKIEFDAKGESFMMAGKKVLKMPFRKNVAEKYAPEFVYWVNLRKTESDNSRPPQVVERDTSPMVNKDRIYPGVRARASVSVFSYKRSDNSGVSLGLNNVQRLGEGKRLDSYVNAKDEFGALDPEAAGDLGTVGGDDLSLKDMLG